MSKLSKIGAVLGIGVVSFAAGFTGAHYGVDNTPLKDLSANVAALGDKQAKTNLALGNLTVTSLDTQNKVNTLVAADVWEGTAEGLAVVELEDRHYKELGRFILNDTSASSSDVKELNLDVTVRDKKVLSSDKDEQNAVVELNLKVYYEDSSGDKQKQYITATATIEDGEVTDLSFA